MVRVRARRGSIPWESLLPPRQWRPSAASMKTFLAIALVLFLAFCVTQCVIAWTTVTQEEIVVERTDAVVTVTPTGYMQYVPTGNGAGVGFWVPTGDVTETHYFVYTADEVFGCTDEIFPKLSPGRWAVTVRGVKSSSPRSRTIETAVQVE